MSVHEMKARYEQEREKRLRADGNAQFIQINQSTQYAQFAADPWADPVDLPSLQAQFPGNRFEMLIIGADGGRHRLHAGILQPRGRSGPGAGGEEDAPGAVGALGLGDRALAGGLPVI
ncbi:hypothetical protein ASPZODRAFT_147684 [Penicilliopsis zonata CBS 506.65]|uniref:Uncharacterized protein n=1 Tax=Penicilliopsis zonata CBS 506.65 TaxID=1073090 RepID=A0A1L9S4W2_9EURO|nr:hypothetical protein ASPZODRAFT_147684 [Penicilliopsis zonata CBS 506.65]OJJ42200.1 hypothetical protein ASPZODRAFT_147684 [Penicilliopsis zonata CBS 506.65]